MKLIGAKTKMKTIMACVLLTGLMESISTSHKVESSRPNHIVLTIGHSAIPTVLETGAKEKMLLVPTWGLSYEYNISEKFALALKGEIEASNYIISDEEGSALEREFPVSMSILGTYKYLVNF